MFSTLGLFRQISCPYLNECNVPQCIFLHHKTAQPVIEDKSKHIINTEAVEDQESPPIKRRKLLDNAQPFKIVSKAELPAPKSFSAPADTLEPLQSNDVVVQSSTNEKPHQNKMTGSNSHVQPVSTNRAVSPPLIKRAPRNSSIAVKDEKLVPRQVSQAPAIFKVRLLLLEQLHKHIKELNAKSETTKSISDQQIITIALDEEEKAAREFSSDIYRNSLSQRVLRFKKMTLKDWYNFLEARSDKKDLIERGTKHAPPLTTALSRDKQIQILNSLQTRLEGLESYGYITAPPGAADILKVKDAVAASGGYESCDRCNTRFQVFPGRNAEGRLSTRGPCRYHWARILRPAGARNIGRSAGQGDAFFPCCNQPSGSTGCTLCDNHVFKVSDPARLASLLQFQQTPDNCNTPEHRAVVFDCEMAYTTQGMELIRLTALSWPEKQTLLDVLVRPYGEILDLNTRFSGVSPEQFATASMHEEHPSMMQNEGAAANISLRKVDSPATARKLLFNLLNPKMPVIGHAIENDLNACRLIHPVVVDTVLLYPHPRGLPARYGLKMLTSKYLNRTIQAGGESGHDSREDSVATADLTLIKVIEVSKLDKE